LEGDIKSLNQDLGQDIKRLNQLHNQATSSSHNNSANNNNDQKIVKKDPCENRHIEMVSEPYIMPLP